MPDHMVVLKTIYNLFFMILKHVSIVELKFRDIEILQRRGISLFGWFIIVNVKQSDTN